MEDHKGENVLIVTAAGNVRVIDYYFNGKPKHYDFAKGTIIKNVLIVTHGVIARLIDYYFKGKPKDYDFVKGTIIKNGGLLTFENSKI
jgi:broad specificity phosphatase PhoE